MLSAALVRHGYRLTDFMSLPASTVFEPSTPYLQLYHPTVGIWFLCSLARRLRLIVSRREGNLCACSLYPSLPFHRTKRACHHIPLMPVHLMLPAPAPVPAPTVHNEMLLLVIMMQRDTIEL